MTSIRDAALSYAILGWRVFPAHSIKDGRCTCGKVCSSPGKHPLTEHGFQDASTDEDQIIEWWRRWPWANVAAAMGQDVVALDVDNLTASRSLGRLPRTVAARTGRVEGGIHAFFSTNGHHITNSAGRLPKGVQVRGEGGYVILPPSLHASGQRYEWRPKQSPFDLGLAAIPEGIVNLIVGKPDGGNAVVQVVGPAIDEGERNTRLASLGGSMRRRGCTEEDITALLLSVNLRCTPPLSEVEVRAIAHSVARYAPAEAPGEGGLPIRIRTAREVAAEVPEQAVWIVKPWVAAGAITELTGKIKAAGKTTMALAMCAAAVTGTAFAGSETLKTKVVYCTEQAPTSFREALARANLIDCDDAFILLRRDARGFPWPEVSQVAGDRADEVGARLIVFDTLSEFAGLRGDQEQSSGFAGEAMEPVKDLADRGFAVIVVRHERKGGGDVSEAARGSSAFGGAADILMVVRRPEKRGQKNQRVVHALSRFEGTPETMVLSLEPDGTYRALGDVERYASEQAELMVEIELESVGPMTLTELIEATGASRSTLRRILSEKEESGVIKTSGHGKQGRTAIRYELAE